MREAIRSGGPPRRRTFAARLLQHSSDCAIGTLIALEQLHY